MARSKDVQDKIDASNKLAEELFAPKVEVVPAVTPPVNTPPVEPEVAPVEEPEVPPVVLEPEGFEPEPIENKEEDIFKHKYDVLKGKYTSELKRANDRITSLETLLSQIASTTPKKEEVSVVAPTQENDEPDADILQFMEDYPPAYNAVVKMLEKQKKKASMEVAEKVTPIEQKLEDEGLQRFYSTLNSSMSDWETINSDPLFIEWLQEPVPYTTITKHQALMNAFVNKDSNTVLTVFTDYKNNNVGTTPAVTSSKLNNAVAPPRGSRSGGANTSPTKTIYKKEDVELFYRNLAQRKTGLTADQIKAKEAEYFIAAKENRII